MMLPMLGMFVMIALGVVGSRLIGNSSPPKLAREKRDWNNNPAKPRTSQILLSIGLVLSENRPSGRFFYVSSPTGMTNIDR
jgi:hypothetical protein